MVAGATGKGAGGSAAGGCGYGDEFADRKEVCDDDDIDGKYAMAIPRNGRYVVRAQLTGFADATQEVVLSGVEVQAANQGITIVPKATDFGLQLASRVAAAEAQQAQSAGSGLARWVACRG